MKSEKYIEDCLKTLTLDMPGTKTRLSDDSTIHMLHAVRGMATEAGELVDMLKKYVFFCNTCCSFKIISNQSGKERHG